MPDIPPYRPDKSPRGPGRPKSNTTAKKLPPDRVFKLTMKEIREGLEAAAGMLVLGFSAAGDTHCATVVMEGSEALIDSWVWMAEKHPEVRRALEVICGSGGYMAVITSTLGIALPIMQHHGMYPKGAPTPRSVKSMMGSMFNAADSESVDETAADAAFS